MGNAGIIALLRLYRLHSKYRFSQVDIDGNTYTTTLTAKDEFINYLIQSGYKFEADNSCVFSQPVHSIMFGNGVVGYMITGKTRLVIILHHIL